MLEIKNLHATVGGKPILRGLDLSVAPGEVHAIMGPNGAGKSTLVKIMMTVVRPTYAEGSVLQSPIGHRPTLAKIGYLPEHHRFPQYLTGRQALDYFAALAKVDRRTRKQRIPELLELVGMQQRADARIRTYSKGMQQRIGLAHALLNDPDLVVLDEPTDGLDPMGSRQVREILQQLKEQDKTVLINSHLLGEVERVCDRVAILIDGKVVRQGTIEELTSRGRRYELVLQGTPDEAVRRAICSASPSSSGRKTSGRPTAPVELDGSTVRVATEDPAEIQPVIDLLRGRGQVIESIRLLRESLEDFFIDVVSDCHADQTADGAADGPAESKGGQS